jgi:hypothetical protein
MLADLQFYYVISSKLFLLYGHILRADAFLKFHIIEKKCLNKYVILQNFLELALFLTLSITYRTTVNLHKMRTRWTLLETLIRN